jgi:hypothetical protein
MADAPTPPRPDPVEQPDRSFAILVWTTVGVNALLGLFALEGWLGRPSPCGEGCTWRPAGGILWVALVLVDVGLVLVWAGVGYLHLHSVGERIGQRLSDRRGDQDGTGS